MKSTVVSALLCLFPSTLNVFMFATILTNGNHLAKALYCEPVIFPDESDAIISFGGASLSLKKKPELNLACKAPDCYTYNTDTYVLRIATNEDTAKKLKPIARFSFRLVNFVQKYNIKSNRVVFKRRRTVFRKFWRRFRIGSDKGVKGKLKANKEVYSGIITRGNFQFEYGIEILITARVFAKDGRRKKKAITFRCVDRVR